MKKAMSLVLIFIMLTSLCACTGNGSDTADAPQWETAYRTDAFGDTTNDAYVYCQLTGSFSNTSEKNAPLSVGVCYDNESRFSFDLLEYCHHKIVLTEADIAVLTAKIGDTVHKAQLTVEPAEGVLSLSSTAPLCSSMETALTAGEDVRCIISIGDAEYTFTIPSAGF